MSEIVVTASNRLARTLRERHNAGAAARGERAWASPEILPWEAWISKLWEAALYSGKTPVRIGEEAARALWERIIAASGNELLQLPATACAASEAWNLMHAWRLERAAIEAEAGEDSRAFLAWAEEFEAACGREGWIDEARLPDYLAARASTLPLPARIVLAGFDEFTPQQQSFLDALRAAGAEARLESPPEAAAAVSMVRVPFTDRAAEIAAAARWARSWLEARASNIGIVFRDLAARRAEVERAFSEALGRRSLFNISAGWPLASYPLVHAALRALELDPAANESSLVSRVLLSPFLGGAREERSARAALDAHLRRHAGNRISAAALVRRADSFGCRILAEHLRRWMRERDAVPARLRPSEWARTFSVLLAKLGWPGKLSSGEYQTVKKWRDLLSQFAALETVLPALAYREALGRLKRMAGALMFQPETEAAPVQILGMLETSGMRFDHLWIGGLEDESWPAPPRPATFLPAGLQRARGIPHASPERELQFARLLTTRLLASAEDVVVSHALTEEDRKLGPSALIRSIPESTLKLPEYPLYSEVVRRSSDVETLEDCAAPPVEGDDAAGGTRVFQYQATCPFRAFAELRLGARPLESPAPGLNAMERGTLVHDALAKIWTELKSHARLCAMPSGELAGLVSRAVRDAIHSLDEQRGDAVPERFAAVEAGRLERILGEWLEVEKLRQPFTVAATENEREAEAGGVTCKVRVDRIDRLDDGRDVLIDYKTGKYEVRSWTGERPDEPQLPLYAATHEGPVAAVLFGQIKTGEVRFKGYADGEGIVTGAIERHDFSVQLDEWRRVLGKLGEDFRAGVADVNPKDAKACRYCSLRPLCRFQEVCDD
ncbi:MAG: PD-(D/E)XK nuclease family protein [Acidobacteriota bacterium]